MANDMTDSEVDFPASYADSLGTPVGESDFDSPAPAPGFSAVSPEEWYDIEGTPQSGIDNYTDDDSGAEKDSLMDFAYSDYDPPARFPNGSSTSSSVKKTRPVVLLSKLPNNVPGCVIGKAWHHGDSTDGEGNLCLEFESGFEDASKTVPDADELLLWWPAKTGDGRSMEDAATLTGLQPGDWFDWPESHVKDDLGYQAGDKIVFGGEKGTAATMEEVVETAEEETPAEETSEEWVEDPGEELKAAIEVKKLQADQRAMAKKIVFHLASDLHFNDRNFNLIWGKPANARYLIIPGDICQRIEAGGILEKFLIKVCGQYKKVIYVTGNNEHRSSQSMERKLPQIMSLPKRLGLEAKLIVLENTAYDLVDEQTRTTTSILGCTLWSEVREHQRAALDAKFGRFASNWEGIPGNNFDAHLRRFTQSFQWLQNEVAAIRKKHPLRKILVVTHHAPMLRGSSRNSDGVKPLTNVYSHYGSDILGGRGLAGLGAGDAWVYGHTHFNNDCVIDGVHVFSNQRGHPHNKEATADKQKYNQYYTFSL